MGPVGPAVVEATFAGFHPSLIRRPLPDAEPGQPRGDHRDAARGGQPSSHPPARRPARHVATSRWWATCCSTPSSGRTRWAGRSSRPTSPLDRPEDPAGRVWHAATVFREHRGDGHVAALTAEGVNGCASHVLAVCGRDRPQHPTGGRRWSDEEWAEAVEGLRRRRPGERGRVADRPRPRPRRAHRGGHGSTLRPRRSSPSATGPTRSSRRPSRWPGGAGQRRRPVPQPDGVRPTRLG